MPKHPQNTFIELVDKLKQYSQNIYDITMNERCEAKIQELFTKGLHESMVNLLDGLNELEKSYYDDANIKSMITTETRIARKETLRSAYEKIKEIDDRSVCSHTVSNIHGYIEALFYSENITFKSHLRIKKLFNNLTYVRENQILNGGTHNQIALDAIEYAKKIHTTSTAELLK